MLPVPPVRPVRPLPPIPKEMEDVPDEEVQYERVSDDEADDLDFDAAPATYLAHLKGKRKKKGRTEVTAARAREADFDLSCAKEMQSWKDTQTYEVVPNEGQQSVSSRWIHTLKDKDGEQVAKSRLVVRDFGRCGQGQDSNCQPDVHQDDVEVLHCLGCDIKMDTTVH